jgi:hypothetical protein
MTIVNQIMKLNKQVSELQERVDELMRYHQHSMDGSPTGVVAYHTFRPGNYKYPGSPVENIKLEIGDWVKDGVTNEFWQIDYVDEESGWVANNRDVQWNNPCYLTKLDNPGDTNGKTK